MNIIREAPNGLKIEITATYIEEVDCTVVWQYIYFGSDTLDAAHEPVQTAIIGWYHGEPNDDDTKKCESFGTIANYY